MMTSSVFGAKQHISKWSSALAVQTRRHRKKKPRDPKCLARSACRYLQPTRVRMVTTLPTESQRYRESGVLTIPLKLCDPHGANLRPSLVPVELYYSAYISDLITYGSLWKKMSYSPGIVNQGRRSICLIHCLHFRHR